MGAHAHYPEHNAPRSGAQLSTLVRFALCVVILAAAIWFIGAVVGEDVATIVTGWFRNV